MTAYIKVIDIWMIVTMVYCGTLLEFIKDDDIDASVTLVQGASGLGKRRAIRVIIFMLDFGLPLIIVNFIIIFWVFGIINTKEGAPLNILSCITFYVSFITLHTRQVL